MMIKVKYIECSGKEHHIEAAAGQTVMEVAMAHNIPGIDADCGGQCACGTCHVQLDERWLDAIGPAGRDEMDMLNLAEGTGPTSRLACQLRLDKSHDGILVRLPAGQH